MLMMPEGAVIISIKEYNNFLKCQKIVEKLYDSCEAHESVVNNGELSTLFYPSNMLLQEMFPERYEMATSKAKENYFVKKMEALKNV
jgi:hypothetical protein